MLIAMNRDNHPPGPRLEKLLDDRDHLLVQISMERDSAEPSADRIEGMRERVMLIENEIKRNWGELRAEKP